MKICHTVTGNVPADTLGRTLAHEHICNYSEAYYAMQGKAYLDKDALLTEVVEQISRVRDECGLRTFVDCSTVNLGRDIELMKEVSRRTGVNIVCASGFYYTVECMLMDHSPEEVAERLLYDIEDKNSGILKLALDSEIITPYFDKMMKAMRLVMEKCDLALCVHTEAKLKNGRAVLAEALEIGMDPSRIIIAHCSDTYDTDYMCELAKAGCYIGLDRMYESRRDDFIAAQCGTIETLAERGYLGRILLSHDALLFNGFLPNAYIKTKPHFRFIFDRLLPALEIRGFTKAEIKQLIELNPAEMLACEK